MSQSPTSLAASDAPATGFASPERATGTAAAASPSSRWKPSLTDFFFLAVIFVCFLSTSEGWAALVKDGDTGLHTVIGRWILDHGTVPVDDPFSFTRAGDRFFAFQWLTGVLYALLDSWVGMKGIVFVSAMVICSTFLVMLRHALLRGSNGLLGILTVLFAGNVMTIHFHARPHIFTLLFLAMTTYVLSRERMSPEGGAHRPWILWSLVPLMWLWANLHSGFPVGLAAIGVAALGTAMAVLWGRRDSPASPSPASSPASWTQVWRYSGVLAASTAVTFLNPNGAALYVHILDFLNDPWTRLHVDEYAPPRFNSEPMYYFAAFLALAAVIVVLRLRRREWTDAMMLGAFGAGALTSVRHVPLFVIVLTPMLAAEASHLLTRLAASRGKGSVAEVISGLAASTTERLQPVSIWAGVIAAGVFLFSSTFPTDLSGDMFPQQMVARHRAELASERVFTTDQWGDYLLYQNYPEQKVFIDGRSDFYRAEVGDPYIAVISGLPGWEKVLDQYDVSTALVPADEPFSENFRSDKTWKLIEEDDQALLFVKR